MNRGLRADRLADQDRAAERGFDRTHAREHLGRKRSQRAEREQRPVDDAGAEGRAPRELRVEVQWIPVAAGLGEGEQVLLREREPRRRR